LKNEVEKQWLELNKEFGLLLINIENLLENDLISLEVSIKSQIYNTLVKSKSFLDKVKILLKKTYNMVDASVISI
jgi:hypothetical protein